MNKKMYTEDDYCDLYKNRICDNCGECLEEEGIDIRAIKIEDIAKTVEENEFLEAELKKAVEEAREAEDAKIEKESTTAEEFLGEEEETEYVDAFEHIEYIDDVEFFDELNLEEMTEEVFPGVRRLKTKK